MAENIPSSDNTPNLPAPFLVLYGTTGKLKQLTEDEEVAFARDPADYIGKLTEFQQDPLQAPAGSIWHLLVQKDVSMEYGFDEVTESAIQADEEWRRHRNSQAKEKGNDLRRRAVAIFISRIIDTGILGKTTVDQE